MTWDTPHFFFTAFKASFLCWWPWSQAILTSSPKQANSNNSLYSQTLANECGVFYICYIGKKLGDFKNRGNKKKYQYQNRWQVRKSGGVIPSLCSQTAQGKKIFALACFPFKNCLHPIWRARTTRILAGCGKNKNIVIVLSWNSGTNPLLGRRAVFKNFFMIHRWILLS